MSNRTVFLMALVAIVAVLQSSATAAVTDVGLWRLGEDDPGAVAGAVTNNPTTAAVGNDLTRNGDPTYSSDTPAYARTPSSLSVTFDGTGDYFSDTSAATSATMNVGFEAWVKASTTAGTDIIAFNGATGGPGYGTLRAGSNYTGLVGGAGFFGSVPVSVGKWQHVATLSNSTDIGLYVDGAFAGFRPLGGAPAATFTVGANNVGGEEFNGNIDAVRIFDTGGTFDTATEWNINNIARQGTGITGISSADDGTLGTPVANAGSSSDVNDGNLLTNVDTFNGLPGNNPFDWVGVTWATPQNDVDAIRLYHSTYPDGGWFGDDTFGGIAAPKVQYTIDGGTTWLDATGLTTDYTSVITVGPTAANTLRPAVDFGFDKLSGINGIRLFGNGGGATGGADTNGFIGVYQFLVFQSPTPEPTSFVLSILGLLGIAVVRPRRNSRSKQG